MLIGLSTTTVFRTIKNKNLRKCLQKKARILCAVLNKSWKQHPTKQQLYCHLPPILQTIQVFRARHIVNNWRSKDPLIREILQRTTTYRHTCVVRPAKTYIHEPCADIGYHLEDFPRQRDRETFVSLFVFYGISTFVDYLMPNPF